MGIGSRIEALAVTFAAGLLVGVFTGLGWWGDASSFEHWLCGVATVVYAVWWRLWVGDLIRKARLATDATRCADGAS